MTQSTLSQQIKQLEQELGISLFNRDSHSVALTEAGAELLPYARKTVADADECHQRMLDLSDVLVGTLNIGVTYSFSPILTESIFTFMKCFKGIKLNVFYKPMAELMDMLRLREVDFVLAFKPSSAMQGIESHTLFQNCLSAIVNSSHPLAQKAKVRLEEIAGYSLALPSKGLQARNALEHILERYNCQFETRIELNDPNILLDLVRQSNFVTILAEASIHNQAGVKAIPIDIPENEMTGCVHTLCDTYHKKSMCEFVKILRDSIAVRERANAWL